MYADADNILHFVQVCIRTTKTAKIYLSNIGHVKAVLKLKLLKETERGRFNLSHTDLVILPYSTEMVSVSFTPKSLIVSIKETGEMKLIFAATINKNNNFLLLYLRSLIAKTDF